MIVLTNLLLVLHFLGLALALSVSVASLITGRLIARSSPEDRAVLRRLSPLMAGVARAGLAVLWGSGLGLLFFRWPGLLSSPPPSFVAKLSLVVALTVNTVYMRVLERKSRPGETAVARRLRLSGRMSGVAAIGIIVLSVLTFG